jgi:hypothetical protein
VENLSFELCEEFNKLNLMIVANTEVMEMEVDLTLLQDIRKGQLEDEKIQEIKCNITEEKSPGFTEDNHGVLWYKGRISVPNIKELKDRILREAHESAYSIHPGGNKMCLTSRYEMKRELRNMLPFARPVRESRPSINDPLGCRNPCEYLSGSGKGLV